MPPYSIGNSLLNCLEGAERNLRKAINISNGAFHTFNNLCLIVNDLDSNSSSEFLIPILDWLQVFLTELRKNVRHHRTTRNQLRDWVNLRRYVRDSSGDTQQ